MKKTIIQIALALFMLQTSTAQEANKTRLKTNPLSPFVAAERNVNLAVERTIQGKKNVIGMQVSGGYIFGWQALQNAENMTTTPAISGFVSTAELRVYGKGGFFGGVYLQAKGLQGKYSIDNYYDPNTGVSLANFDVVSKRNTTSAGLVGGYNFDLTNKLGAEIYSGLGLSQKQFRENGKNTQGLTYIDTNEFSLLIDESGRYPQFLLTCKLIYAL